MKLTIVDPDRARRVEQLLQRAVEADRDLARNAARVRDGLVALEQLAALTPGALGDAPWDGQAFRAVVERFSLEALDPRRVGELVRGESGTVAATAWLIDPGALAIVGLAAMRIGAARGLQREYLATVFGLALAAGRAEALAGLLVPREIELWAVRGILSDGADEGADLTALQVIADPVERRRWRLLVALFEELAAEGDSTPLLDPLDVTERGAAWMGLSAEPAISHLRANTDGTLQIGMPGDGGGATVVIGWFATPHAVGGIVHLDAARELGFTLPEGVPGCWVGAVVRSSAVRANRDRQRLRLRWAAAADRLELGAVPVLAIPDLHPRGGLPPWPQSLPWRP